MKRLVGSDQNPAILRQPFRQPLDGVANRRGRQVQWRRCAALALTIAGVAAVSEAPAEPVYVENAAVVGINFNHAREAGATFFHNERIAAGLAVGDYNNDGWPDVYLCNGWGRANQLYRNDQGTFTEVAGDVGADLALTNRETKCALFVDYDGDGWLDLFVAHDGDPDIGEPSDTLQHQLFRNLGNGQFSDETVSAEIPTHPYQNFGPGYTVVGGLNAGDLNGDGYPEIYVSYWHDRDTLLLNNGDGTFTDISAASGIDVLGADSWSAQMWDVDRDGWLDIFVAVDFIECQLFINQCEQPPCNSLTFIDQADDARLNVATHEMGTTLGDYDNDGDLDLYITNLERPLGGLATSWNWLFRNDRIDDSPGLPLFTDVGPDMGTHLTGWAWGTTFVDYNNDGWLDIGAVNGQPGTVNPYFQTDPSKFFQNDGGVAFTDVSDSVGFNDTLIARGLIAFDYDRDGDQDLLVTNYLDPALLYENVGGAEEGNWIVVDPIGDAPNTRALGATVFIETQAGGMKQMRLITAGTSFLSQEPDVAHFGVASATMIDSLRVVWADGTEDIATDVPVNQYVEFIQGVGIAPDTEPESDPVSLDVTGPGTVTEGTTFQYVVMATYENDVEAEVTDQASWTVIAGAEHAEFSAADPGELTALLLADELETADVTIQATFESLVGTLDMSIIASGVDLDGPTLAIASPTTETETVTEESTVTLTGTAQDSAGVMAVAWSSDQGNSGPCSGLADWTTGPISLREGVNLITISARDGLQNTATVALSVTYTIPAPPIDPDPPEDPDPPIDPDPPADEPDAPAPDDSGDSETPDEDDPAPTPDLPTQGTPSSGLCGALALFSLPMIVMGLCALRRRAA